MGTYEIINTVIASIAIIGLLVATPCLVRELTRFFRLLGNISDKDAEKHNLPFSKHFKLKLDDASKQKSEVEDGN